MRVPTRSAGTRSGVNCRRLNEPPSTSETVLTVSVLARPGTPSSSTWPPASSATITRSSIDSCPTMTRLISNSAASSASWASRAGLISRRPSSPSRARSRGSSGVKWLLLADLGGGLVGTGAQLDREGLRVPVALHDDLHGIAGLLREHSLSEIGRGCDRPSVELGDHVAGAQAAVARRGAGHLADERAVARSRVRGGHAEPRAV